MNYIDHNIITIVTFLPFAGALLLAIFPRRDRDIRWFALGISLVTLLASLHLPWHYVRGLDGFQFEQNVPWISHPNIHYHLGIDGISMWLVVLTTFLTPLCVLISWKSVNNQVKEFFILMLILETAMIGVFVALDLFLFYFFWEATLIPMALIIGIYGHGRRIYAAVKFFLYTMIASVFMLAAIIWLYAHTGSFDFVTIRDAIQNGQVEGFSACCQVAVPRLLCGVCGEGPALPSPHLAARRARGSADGRFRPAGGCAAEDGYLRPAAIQCWPLPRPGAAQRTVDHRAGDHQHHLRRAGRDGATQRQEADRLHLGQPPGLRRARHLQLYPDWHGRRGVPDAESRRLHRRAVHAVGHDLRSPSHLRHLRVRRHRDSHAGIRHVLYLHHAVVGRDCRC